MDNAKSSIEKSNFMAFQPRKKSSDRKRNAPSRSNRSAPSFESKRAGNKSSERSNPSRRGPVRKKSRPVSSERHDAGSVFAGSAAASAGKRSKANPPVDFGGDAHRLQQVLAAAGFGSRRQCEELITDGRVDVDGQTASLGMKVNPTTQKIRVDGEALPKTKPVYLAMNKPKGFLCTGRDQQGRRRAIDLVPQKFGRVFPIGRLDANSEGLLLLTNDGALCQRLAHPKYEVSKKYQVQVAGLVEPDLIVMLKKGVHLAEGIVQADDAVLKSCHKKSSILEITLTEGKNREIRRMLARAGHKVMQLKRVAVGSVKLGKLLSGDVRELTHQEVARLYGAAKRETE